MDNRNIDPRPEQEKLQQEKLQQEKLQQEIAEGKAEAQEAAEEIKEAAEEIEEAKAEEALLEKKEKGQKNFFRSNKWKRGSMATVMSVVFVAIVVVINILVGLLTDRFPSLNMDLTAEKLNTLSDQAVEIAKSVEQDTTIYLIGAEENYRENRIYASYGLEYSQVANLAERLREVNPKISVEFIDPDTNPTFISTYADESLRTGMVMVRTEKRHKVLEAVPDLFIVRQNSSTYTWETYSKVDSALAGALELVNLDRVPVLTIATGHGELLTSDTLANFLDMLKDQNFDVKEINFMTEEIPEDTQLLMLPTPTTDYTEEEIGKLREYIDDTTRTEQRALLATFHPTQASLPKLSAFLEEWGIRVEEGMVAETDPNRAFLGNYDYVLVDHTTEFMNDKDYEYLLSPSSRPLTLLFKANGDVVNTEKLWTTSDSAYAATEDLAGLTIDSVPKSSQTVACISEKRPRVDGTSTTRDVLVFGSSRLFLDQYMSSSFDNRSYVLDLIKYCTGTDDSQVTVISNSVQTNVLDVVASSSTINLLGLGVFTIGLPVLILIVGLVVFLKRRHL